MFSLSGWPRINKCLNPYLFKLSSTFGICLNGRKSRAQSPYFTVHLCHKEYLDRSHIAQTAKTLFVYIFYTGRVTEQTTFFYSLLSFLVVEQELVRAWSVDLPWSASKYYLVSHSIFLFCFVQQVAEWHLQLEKNVCRKPGPSYSNLIQFTKPSGLKYGNSGKLTYEPGQAHMRFQAVANSKFKAGVFSQLWEEVERISDYIYKDSTHQRLCSFT